jgi:hypothetical protein
MANNWAYVEDGVIKEIHYNLPQSWRNISNFFALENEPEILKSYGWCPIINRSEAYDPTQVEIGKTTYEIDPSGVVFQTTTFTPKIISSNIQRELFITSLRAMRNFKLTECDWTQLADIQQFKDDVWKTNWSQYRQALRDLPEVYSNEPYTNVVRIEEVVWPEQPNS